MWRPNEWKKSECEGCERRIDDEFGKFFCGISCGEHTSHTNYEAGADAMLEALAGLVGDDGYITFEKEDGKVVAVYIDD